MTSVIGWLNVKIIRLEIEIYTREDLARILIAFEILATEILDLADNVLERHIVNAGLPAFCPALIALYVGLNTA